jgi:hypothetical protein
LAEGIGLGVARVVAMGAGLALAPHFWDLGNVYCFTSIDLDINGYWDGGLGVKGCLLYLVIFLIINYSAPALHMLLKDTCGFPFVELIFF